MYFTAEIQAREPERAKLAAAEAQFLAAGNQVHHLPGPGEPREAGVDRSGVPQCLPAGEQTQHIHRQRSLDRANWQTRQAMIEANGERVREEASKGAGVAAIALAIKLTRADVRAIAAALGIAIPSSKRKQAEQPTFAALADQVEAKPELSDLDLLAGQLLAMATLGKTSSEARQATGLKAAKFRELCDRYGIRFEGAA